MRKLGKVVLLLLIVVTMFSCRNVIITFPPINNETKQDREEFENTFASIDWNNLVTTAVANAGKGKVDGMLSNIDDTPTNSAISALAIQSEQQTLFLHIEFDNYTDSSGIVISNGELTFDLEANAFVDESSSTVVYNVTAYTLHTSQRLYMTSYGVTSSLSTEGIHNNSATMTIKRNGNFFTASNVSLAITESSGTLIFNGNSYSMNNIWRPSEDLPEELPAGSEGNPYTITDYSDFIVMGSMLEGTTETLYFQLGKDVRIPVPEGMTTGSLLPVPEGSSAVIDLNGYSVMPARDQMATKIYLISVAGELIVNGEGTIGGTYKTNGISRAFNVMESGYLELNNVNVMTFSETQGSSIYNEGTVVLNGATINSSYYAIGQQSTGTLTINDGSVLTSIASNALTLDGTGQDIGFAYTVSSSGTIEINEAEIYGIQGAISIIGGSATLNNGVHSETTIHVFEMVPADFTSFYNDHLKTGNNGHNTSELHYGLYVAGERASDDNPKCIVNGGEYISNDKSAIFVGNTADGGAGATAYAWIYGGTFTSPEGKAVISASPEDGYGQGILEIAGGRYSSDEKLNLFYNSDVYQVIPSPDGYYEVIERN